VSYQPLVMEEFDIFYQILVDHFPKKEVKEYSYLKGMFENGIAHALVKKKDDTIIGALCYMEVEDYVFIDYFVIIDAYQGKQLGQQMLQYFKETMNKPIILEVELPTDDISKRRIAFYKRMGFVLNEHEYVVPPIRSLKYPIYFLLMTDKKPLTREKFDKIYPSILKIVYGFTDIQ